ncbi:ABC transporter ATP-binding protein, partial [bacterium]|nr:ABC transporter ATP-binding protein [candidate division CSSED10-310 bacterium]
GAGKTTLLRIICGLLTADRGTVEIFGLDHERRQRQVRDLIGYMPQRFSLYPDLSVNENLVFFATLYGVRRTQRRQRMARLLRFSRLGPFARRRAGALSGGMKQKLALSCTLIHEPRLLLLDEPTTGVDPVSRREFWKILQELRDEGVSILITTPYMDEAARCDRIAFMHHGAILAEAPPAEITNHFHHHIIAFGGRAVRSLRPSLEAMQDIHSVKEFGDHIHVATDNPDSIRRQGAALMVGRPKGEVVMWDAEPGIEDAFLSLMEES